MNTGSRKSKKPPRRAVTMCLAALMLSFLLGMVAFAIDVGYIVLVRTQLQVAADSAALAGAAKMIESATDVVATAQHYAGRHVAADQHVQLRAADVGLGIWNFYTRTFIPSGPRENAIRVTTRRDDTSGGKAPLFFAGVFGVRGCALQTEAMAAFVNNFDGFRMPSSGENLPMLPLTIHQQTCQALLDGMGSDDWSWDAESARLIPASDGVPEANLYPQQTGSPGNFGTIDIGNTNNSTSDLCRQILNGVSSDDLSYHGGELRLDHSGVLELNGDPGVSAGIKDALAAIKGEPRIITIYDQVSGSGNNAQYRIVGFMGVRIMEVELGGGISNKHVIIQPARMITRGGIPASDTTPRSHFIFSPACLVR